MRIPARGLPADLGRIRAVSAAVERRLADAGLPRLEGLSYDELRDLGRAAALAEFLLARHEDKREMRDVLRGLASAVSEAARSIETVDDEIAELLLEAEDSIGRVRSAHARLAERSEIAGHRDGPEYGRAQTCATNLTRPGTEIDTA